MPQRLTNNANNQHAASWILVNITSNQTTANHCNMVSISAEYQSKQLQFKTAHDDVRPLTLMSQILQRVSPCYIGFPARN